MSRIFTIAVILLLMADVALVPRIAARESGSGLGEGCAYRADTLERFRLLLEDEGWSPADPPRNAQGMLEAVHEKTGLTFVLIPIGRFPMGRHSKSGADDNYPVHMVRVPAFLLARTECTQRSWDRLGGTDGRAFTSPHLPIDSVCWDDVVDWCGRAGLRLPSESEWEYACQSRKWTYDDLRGSGRPRPRHRVDPDLEAKAWYRRNSNLKTHPVATKSPNAWGLHDMLGNVYEWCEDYYVAQYINAPANGSPRLNASPRSHRVVRGASWHSPDHWVRSTFRNSCHPGIRHPYNGIRPAADLPKLVGSDDDGHAYEKVTIARFGRLLEGDSWSPAEPPRNAQGMLEAVHRRTGLTFLLIPWGEFVMGSPQEEEGRREDEGPVHLVRLSPYLLCKTECTQSAWKRGGGQGEPFFEGGTARWSGSLGRSVATGALGTASGSRASRSGSTPVGRGPPRRFRPGNCSTRTRRTTTGTVRTVAARRGSFESRPWPHAACQRIPGDFTRCTETSVSGVRTPGTTATRAHRKTGPLGRTRTIGAGSGAAAAGSTPRVLAGLQAEVSFEKTDPVGAPASAPLLIFPLWSGPRAVDTGATASIEARTAG